MSNAIDLEIYDYICKNIDEDFGKILKQDERFPVFFHLSKMREGLFNWYEFKKNANLLEVGAGFGALTGLFCERCSNVVVTERNNLRARSIKLRYKNRNNLKVLQGDISTLDIQEKFDYIIIVGLLEKIPQPQEFLKQIKTLLQPDGKILFTVDNRNSAHYICGGTKPLSDMKPFDNISMQCRYGFSKKDIEIILQGASIERYRFFYPLPDYRLPQLIYSEQYLPQNKLNERLRPYYLQKHSLVADERVCLDKSIEDNLFSELTNSYLLECYSEDKSKAADFAAVTMDRKKEKACITKIYYPFYVEKKEVYREGFKNIQGIFNNMEEMLGRGLCVTPHDLKNNVLIMPYCRYPLLSSYLADMVKQKKVGIIDIFDKLYQDILNSSNHISPYDNYFYKTIKKKNMDWGPILKKAYIEMIPMNCFYDGSKFIYFDQEFTKENCPAKYVLFRALRNSYLFINGIEECVPLVEMKRHFQMEKIWKLFEQADDDFLSDIREVDTYKSFYKWASVNGQEIENNKKKMMEVTK